MRKIIVTIDDDGRFVDITTEEVEKIELCFDKPAYSQYAVVFDKNCTTFMDDDLENKTFIKLVETYCNEHLRIMGELYLRDVYIKLGIPIKDEIIANRVGWRYGPDKKPWSDGCVIFDVIDDNGKIIIDFNVDGDIIHDKLF